MITLIAAVAENNAIGNKGELLCHLPADLKHFKSVTMGAPVIMGRKTYESLPKGLLPGRLNIIVTRNIEYNVDGAVMAHNMAEAIQAASEYPEAFIIGGERLYFDGIAIADRVCLTRIHHKFGQADAYFPEIAADKWRIKDEERHEADDRNPFAYTFINYERVK